MIRKSAFSHLLLMLVSIACFELCLNSCASQSSPNGGPRDTIAPSLDTSFPPNFTTNFKSRTIELIFDEYINLKNPNQQILISPLLKNKPEIKLKGETIFIEFKDSLKANSTYTISFGSSITDFREGNANKTFKYIFSTGSFIDSLAFTGHVRKTLTGENEQDLFVALFEVPDSIDNLDSLAYKNIPTYYGFTDENGHFKMDYLKSGNFLFLGFDDLDGDFKLNGNEKNIVFKKEIIATSENEGELDFFSFEPEPELKYFGARHQGYGKISFGFNKKAQNPSIKLMNADSILKLYPNEKGDSLHYWFGHSENVDSLVFLVDIGFGPMDTSIVFLREYEKSKLNLGAKIVKVKRGDTLVLKSNIPLVSRDTSKMRMIRGSDTLSLKFFPVNDPFTIKISNQLSQKPAFDLVFLKNSFFGINGEKNDSIGIKFRNLKAEDLGNLDFKVIAFDKQKLVLEIYDSKSNLVQSHSFQDSTTLNLKRFYPGKYKARVVFDSNEDGIWTTGNPKKRIQAERVAEYQEEIEIRANWDLELKWLMKKAKLEAIKP